MFFISKLPIVARRRERQLATTAPVLTTPGRPPTWFPGEGLATQAQFCNLLLHMFLEIIFCPEKFYMCYLMLFLFCFESDSKFVVNQNILSVAVSTKAPIQVSPTLDKPVVLSLIHI